MLSSSLVSAVERDLTVARQLAYFHVGYSPDGQDMEVEPEQFISGGLHATLEPTSTPAANASTHMRVAVSNPVQRPRQGTCAVLMELTRPLTWFSYRGRQRGSVGSAISGPAAAAAGTTATPAVGRVAGSAGASSSPSAIGGNPLSSGDSAFTSGGSAVTSQVPYLTNSSCAVSGGGAGVMGSAIPSSSASNPTSVPAASSSSKSHAGRTSLPTSTLPLLIATATFEVVFPMHYPHEPCQWHVSEEVSFGGVGDQATSSWAVTASHRSGSRGLSSASSTFSPPPAASNRAGVWSTNASVGSVAAAAATSLGGEEGVPRRAVSTRLLAAASGENAMRSTGEGSVSRGHDDRGGGVAAAAESPKLTAFVVPALGRQLLRWIAEGRGGGMGAGSAGTSSSPHTRPGRADVSPFLRDFACLLRCWTAVELDVHHLVLPPRLAMAYRSGNGGGASGGASGGGGGNGSGAAQMLRVMAGASNTPTAIHGPAGAAVVSNAAAASSTSPSPSAVGSSGTGIGGAGTTAGDRLNAPTRITEGVASAMNPLSSTSIAHAGNLHGAAMANLSISGSGGSAGGALLGNGASLSANGGTLSVGTSSTATVPTAVTALAAGTTVAAGGAVGSSGGVSSAGPSPSTSTGASAYYSYRRRAGKHFLAVLLPQGDVAICGSVGPAAASARRGGHPTPAAAAATPTATATVSSTAKAVTAVQLDRVPFCVIPLYDQMRKSAEADGASKAVSPLSHRAAAPAVPPAGTLVSCTSQLTRGKVLPSFLLPSHVLGSPYKCDWDDVRLFTGKSSDAALHANAKLAKALHLPDVSDLFQVLRRLAKNVGTTTTGIVYLGEVLWPTLMETVRVLRSTRLPFWAGIALCALLLPSVLESEDEQQQQQQQLASGSRRSHSGRGILPSIGVVAAASAADAKGELGARPGRQWDPMFAALIDVVRYTERVLAVAQEYTLLCEARLVRCALQRGQQHLRLHVEGQRTAGVAMKLSSVTTATPAELCRRLHAPISVCAVCGLSLLRNTVKQPGGEGRDLDRVSEGAASYSMTHRVAHLAKDVAATRTSVQTRRAEGCLVVQCARCGHGGHVEHISSWWNDPTVHCCPKGCDCICEY